MSNEVQESLESKKADLQQGKKLFRAIMKLKGFKPYGNRDERWGQTQELISPPLRIEREIEYNGKLGGWGLDISKDFTTITLVSSGRIYEDPIGPDLYKKDPATYREVIAELTRLIDNIISAESDPEIKKQKDDVRSRLAVFLK